MADEQNLDGVDAAATGTLIDGINELLDSPLGEVESSTIDEPLVEAPSGDGVADGAEGVEVKKEGEVVEDLTNLGQAPSELDSLKAQIEALKGVVTQLSAPKEEAKKELELVPNLDELINGVDFDEIMESKEKFMEFFKKAFQISSQSTTGYIQGMVPDVVTRQVSMAEVRENFYKENTDLNAVRPYVAMVASNVASANPEMGVAEVLAKAAEVARESLGISKVAPTETRPTQKAPALPGARGVRTAPQQKSKLQSEIDDLLED